MSNVFHHIKYIHGDKQKIKLIIHLVYLDIYISQHMIVRGPFLIKHT